MLHYIFRFADGDRERSFKSTFDAYCAISEAYNFDGFLGARLAADEKEGYVSILEVEEYLLSLGKVRDYLELASSACFDDAQILEDIRRDYDPSATSILPAWRKHMDEYSAGYDEWISRVSVRFQCFDKDWVADDGRSKIPVPNDSFMIKVWEAANIMMSVCADDCGANLHHAKDYCLDAAKRFKEISDLCIDAAKDYQNTIELNELYAPSDDEPWYNK